MFNSGPKRLEALYEMPYIIVYGRVTCGRCVSFKNRLDKKGIDYISEKIDDSEVRKVLFERMKASGHTSNSFGLPVVDVNGLIYTNPDFEKIMDKFNSIPKEKDN